MFKCAFFVRAVLFFSAAAASPPTVGVSGSERPCVGAGSVAADWLAQVDRKYILLGEPHGSVQAPDVALDVACAFLQSAPDGKVLVALERHYAFNANLQTYVQSDQGADAREAFRKATSEVGGVRVADWAGEDGRSSLAIYQLALDLARVAKENPRLSVIYFDELPTTIEPAKRQLPFNDGVYASIAAGSQTARDYYMASNVYDAATEFAADRVVVLMGNLHARKKPAPVAGLDTTTLALLLPDAEVFSVLLSPEGGQTWHCVGPDDCGEKPRPARVRAFDGGDRLAGDLFRREDGYDAALDLGVVTASPPVLN